MTINELLLNKHYRGNQTLLSKDLNINRGTLRKYMLDDTGDFHFIVENAAGKVELYANLSTKESK